MLSRSTRLNGIHPVTPTWSHYRASTCARTACVWQRTACSLARYVYPASLTAHSTRCCLWSDAGAESRSSPVIATRSHSPAGTAVWPRLSYPSSRQTASARDRMRRSLPTTSSFSLAALRRLLPARSDSSLTGKLHRGEGPALVSLQALPRSKHWWVGLLTWALLPAIY